MKRGLLLIWAFSCLILVSTLAIPAEAEVEKVLAQEVIVAGSYKNLSYYDADGGWVERYSNTILVVRNPNPNVSITINSLGILGPEGKGNSGIYESFDKMIINLRDQNTWVTIPPLGTWSYSANYSNLQMPRYGPAENMSFFLKWRGGSKKSPAHFNVIPPMIGATIVTGYPDGESLDIIDLEAVGSRVCREWWRISRNP